MQLFFGRGIREGNIFQESQRVFKINTDVTDFSKNNNDNKNPCLIDSKKLLEYAKENPKKNNIEIFKEMGCKVPEASQINNIKFFPELFYKNNEKGELIPKKNFYNENKDKFDEVNDRGVFSILNDEKSSENNSLNKRRSTFFLKRNTPLKNNIMWPEQSSKKKTKEEKELKHFLNCMNHYYRDFSGKIPEEIPFENIRSLGHIYYIIKFPKYLPYFPKRKTQITKTIKLDFDIEFPAYSNNNNLLQYKKGGIVDFLISNYKICDKIFVENESKSGITQLIEEFSEKIKIFSSKKSNVTMRSINSIEYPEDDYLMEKIVYDNISEMFSVNKVKCKEIGDYDIILILPGKKIQVKKDKEFINFKKYKKNNLSIFDDDENKPKSQEKYYFTFFLGENELISVEVKNDEKKTGINNTIFTKIMKEIKLDEFVLISFIFNPLNFFNINSGLYDPYPIGYQSVTFIDSSNNNIQINNIFELIISK